jgi:hypothetical protein
MTLYLCFTKLKDFHFSQHTTLIIRSKPFPRPNTASVLSAKMTDDETQHVADLDAVLSTFQMFLDGIRDRDKDRMLSFVLPTGGATLSRPPNTLILTLTEVVERIPFDELAGTLEEVIYDPEVKIDHDIAMIWAPYKFYIDGEIHHVGTNIVSLLKREGVWKISCVADNSRQPSPK